MSSLRTACLLIAGALAALIGLAGAMVAIVAASSSDPAAGAAHDSLGIPPTALSAYVAAAARAPELVPGCVIPPSVLMAVGKVESGHARGRIISAAGDVVPPILGPALDGSLPGTSVVADTDRGELDGDASWDHALGPMQILPSQWAALGRDANGDGRPDPQNYFDSALTSALHLCRPPADLSAPASLELALRSYNPSDEYVTRTLGWAEFYGHFRLDGHGEVVGADGLYALPVDRALLTLPALRRPHHDYPAWDLPLPIGTAVFAVAGGIATLPVDGDCGIGVSVAGDDGFRYVYCHGSAAVVPPGERVVPGQQILVSGTTGESTGPHLHLAIAGPRGWICPQPLLQAWWEGFPVSPASEITTNCVG